MYIILYRRTSLMAKTLYYGYSNTSSNLVSVNNGLYSLMVEQNTVNICIDVQVILRAYFEIKFNILFLLAQW